MSVDILERLGKADAVTDADLDEARAVIARMRHALDQYADEGRWGYHAADTHEIGCRRWLFCPANGWELAKEALQ